jgi:tetratricopeptide (TPR) repeat protein
MSIARRLAVVVLTTALLTTGCRTSVERPDAGASAAVDPTWPASPTRYRTTSGSIYLDNLDARIAERTRQLPELPGEHSDALARDLYHRYRVVGRFADAEAALQLLDARAGASDATAATQTLRAIVLTGLHRFDEAGDALAAAAEAGADAAELHRIRVELDLARGDYRGLQDELARSTEFSADFHEQAHRADLRLQLGDADGAYQRYRIAQGLYRDVNPVPLAWLHVQQGIALLRNGEVRQARDFFAAAHARLPRYYLATEHLAECEALLGRLDEARRLYLDVIGQTGNPEFIAALAGVEEARGRHAEAARLRREATAGFAALIERQPAAFGAHAAEFFIEQGEVARADALARANLERRRDVGSWVLASETALATGDRERACEARRAAAATGLRPPELAGLDARLGDCGSGAGAPLSSARESRPAPRSRR